MMPALRMNYSGGATKAISAAGRPAMKTLLLLRHAKASKQDPSQRDFDRPLNESGLADAELIGKFMRKMKLEPDLIISSPAVRARQTAEVVLKSADLEVELRFDDRIYEASVRTLLEVISQIDDSVNALLLVGHNPGFEELVGLLTNARGDMPTASLACIELGADHWNAVQAEAGQSKWLVSPKDLKLE